MTMMARRPASTRLSSRRSSGAAWMSRADRGSSSSSSSGSTARARATATRCACPPDSSPGRRSARSAASTSASQCRAVSRASRWETPALRGPKATLSRALRCGNSRASWASRAVPRRCGARPDVHVRAQVEQDPAVRLRPGRCRGGAARRSPRAASISRPRSARARRPSRPAPRLSETSKRRAARAASSVNVMRHPPGVRAPSGCRTRPARAPGRRARRRRPPPRPAAGTARRRRRRRSRAAGRSPAAGCG